MKVEEEKKCETGKEDNFGPKRRASASDHVRVQTPCPSPSEDQADESDEEVGVNFTLRAKGTRCERLSAARSDAGWDERVSGRSDVSQAGSFAWHGSILGMSTDSKSSRNGPVAAVTPEPDPEEPVQSEKAAEGPVLLGKNGGDKLQVPQRGGWGGRRSNLAPAQGEGPDANENDGKPTCQAQLQVPAPDASGDESGLSDCEESERETKGRASLKTKGGASPKEPKAPPARLVRKPEKARTWAPGSLHPVDLAKLSEEPPRVFRIPPLDKDSRDAGERDPQSPGPTRKTLLTDSPKRGRQLSFQVPQQSSPLSKKEITESRKTSTVLPKEDQSPSKPHEAEPVSARS